MVGLWFLMSGALSIPLRCHAKVEDNSRGPAYERQECLFLHPTAIRGKFFIDAMPN